MKFFFFLLFPAILSSQVIDRQYIDSISPILANNKDDASVIRLADSICYAIRAMNPKDANVLYGYFDKSVSDDRLKMVIYDRWGPTLASIGEVEKSYRTRHKALRLAKKLENEDYITNVYNSLTRYFVGITVADSAAYYNHLMEALVLKSPETRGQMLWDVNYMKGEVQKLLGNTKKQGEFYEKAWQVLDGSTSKSQQGFFLYILTEHFQQEKNIAKQSYYGNLLVEYYNKKGLKTPNYHFPVESVFLKNDSPEEIGQLKEVIESSKEQNNLSAYAATVGILADSYLKNGTSEKAIPYLEELIQKLDSANYPYNHTRDRDLLQQAYAASGNYKVAYHKLHDFKNMADSIRNRQVVSKIADFEVKYETEKKEGQIKLLSVENKKNKQLQKVYLVMSLLGVLIVLLLSFFFVKIRKKNSLLAKQKHLLEATVDEKNVLLRETHHRVKNSFQIVSSLLYLQSETIQDKEAQLAIKEAQNRVRSMVLIHQKLYSKDQLVGINTEEYFTDLTHDIFESHQFEGNKIAYNLEVEPLVLNIETITPLGLILNEMITNVLKHAFNPVTEKSVMSIRLKRDNETLQLEVEDNGKGMPSEIKESSFGIQLITALAKKLKAQLSFPSTSEGTLATLKIHRFTEL